MDESLAWWDFDNVSDDLEFDLETDAEISEEFSFESSFERDLLINFTDLNTQVSKCKQKYLSMTMISLVFICYLIS